MADLRHGRYPSAMEGGCSWHGMIGDTNAPEHGHWYYNLAENDKPKGWDFFKQPGGVLRQGLKPDGKVNWVPNAFAENINNLIDNAVKYGGDTILIELKSEAKNVIINVIDNGVSLEKQYKDKLFEQFYRIPKGNVHEVKGFGIGLYYTKKIIEKHNGTIQLELQKEQTLFKITLPNE